ncbi:MAG TPA: alpha/beta hydrolase-fold protein [Gemmatimonadaceae bacterium]|nr:alpha/beta hydrolase-fold protein [Gemmatimonadaceae bacterium]
MRSNPQGIAASWYASGITDGEEVHLSGKSARSARRGRKSENGVITARPCLKVSGTGSGLQPLRLAKKRDGVIYVPETHDSTRPGPVVLMLHGAGANAHDAIQPFRRQADIHGVVLVAPEARSGEWDLMDGGFGADVDFIDHALTRAFELCAIDPKRVAIEGFSDGASYALSLGLRNPDLFTHVIAFSPGFMAIPSGSPSQKVFVAHGSSDVVLPAARCSHRIVARLKEKGYRVTYRQFPGGHQVPIDVAAEAISWLLTDETALSLRAERDG